MYRLFRLAAAFATVVVLVALPRSSQAQITENIVASISHSFIVNNTALPPGKYTFHMIQQTGEAVMRVSSADGRIATDFLVRDSINDHLPQHTELVFNRYGGKEFLARIYESGTKIGASVVNVSREEACLKNQGQTGTTHTEEQTR